MAKRRYIRRDQPEPQQIDAGIDSYAAGRAEAVFEFEMQRWQLLIDAAFADRGISQERRAAAVAALRIRQHADAITARRAVEEEERQRARGARAFARGPRPFAPDLALK